MIRKQVFIEHGQNQDLKRLSLVTGRSEAALIREGISCVLENASLAEDRWKAGLRNIRGMWADRAELDIALERGMDARRRGKERLLRSMGRGQT